MVILKIIQFNLPSDYEESQYYKEIPHITNESPAVKNNLLNLLRNREDLKKWLLATSNYGNEIQEDLTALVGYDEKFNNAIVRHSLDLKDEAFFCNPNPINVTLHDMKKFDLVNVIGKLATQVRASKLTDYQLTKNILNQGEVDKLQLRIDGLKYGINKDEDDDEGRDGGGGGGSNDGMPGPGLPLPRTLQEEMEDIVRRLDFLRENTLDVSPDNTREQNSRIIPQKNQGRFQNRQIKEREKELSNIPKGIINKRKLKKEIYLNNFNQFFQMLTRQLQKNLKL